MVNAPVIDLGQNTKMARKCRRFMKDLLDAGHAPSIESFVKGLCAEDAYHLLFDWALWSREEQRWPVGAWQTWLILAGRGFGKTRTGVETVRGVVERGLYGRVAIVAEDAGDARDVLIEGESGLLAISDPRFYPIYEPSKRRVTWPNGAIATLYADADPEALRGPQHDFALVDELAKFRNQDDTWSNLMFGLRLGQDPRVMVTTTPKPTKLIRELLRDPTTHVTRGRTYDNAANLAPTFLSKIIKKYEGTRLGRQELNAEVLDDMPGALWSSGMIEASRVKYVNPEMLNRVVTGVDPSASEDGAEAGIVTVGRGDDGDFYVLADDTVQGRPQVWGSQAVRSWRKHKGDRIIAEQNNGGLMVEDTIRHVDNEAPVKLVTASRGKLTRAEPVSALYEQGRVHHVGLFPDLEDQMTTYEPLTAKVSPDRMDALVWAITELAEFDAIDMNDAAVELPLTSATDFPR